MDGEDRSKSRQAREPDSNGRRSHASGDAAADPAASPPPGTNAGSRQDETAASSSDERENSWFESRTGAVVNTAFVAAAVGVANKPRVRELLQLGARIVRHPATFTGPAARMVEELTQIAAGRSELAPWRVDRRYADPAWSGNPLLRRLAQAHSAGSAALIAVIDAATLDPAADYRLRLAAEHVSTATAPANWPLFNPVWVKTAIDTGGASVILGTRRLVSDMSRKPRLPRRSAPDDFAYGVDVAATPGAVVQRTELSELIHYQSTTRDVHAEPLLIVPSVVNKFYLTDMSPKVSLTRYAVATGHQVFALSWANVDGSHRALGLDAYVDRIVQAVDAAKQITGAERVNLLGVCAGGQLATIAAAHLAASGRAQELATLTLLVSVLEQSEGDLPQGLLDRSTADAAMRAIDRRGYVDGRDLTGSLGLLRPVDSMWWPWVHRYLAAADMPKRDLFYWSEDVTNIPAALIRDQIGLVLDNSLADPESLTVLGTPIDLNKLTVDTYLLAGRADHITPWKACYRSVQLLGSDCRFVLVDGGHIQSLLRPPEERVVPYLHGPVNGSVDVDEWLRHAVEHHRSWWEDWTEWLDERSPTVRRAKRTVGSREHPASDPAPGIYVRRRLDQA